MNWTQPVCGDCYAAKEPDRVPVALKVEFREHETCCFCGQPTDAGIYYRIDPRTVPHPKAEEAA
jgi:hypothetical protein